MMRGYEIIGRRIDSRTDAAAILAAAKDPQKITRIAAVIGSKYGMPDADHFHVPRAPGSNEMPLEDHMLVCYIAKWADDIAELSAP